MSANKEKNDFFYEYEKECVAKLSERNKNTHWLTLIDFFQDNWEKYLEKENRAEGIFKAACKSIGVNSCHTKIVVNKNVNEN